MTDLHLARWRADPCGFIESVLHDPETGRPFVLLDAEREFLQHALTFDSNGRLVFSEWLFGSIKKSGKTGFAALLVIMVLLLFGGRYAEAYVAANDLEQSRSRVFEQCRRIIEASPLLRREAKITQDKITFTATGATITCLAGDFAGAAGAHPVISVFDELWAVSSERGRRLYDELVAVPTRKFSCRLGEARQHGHRRLHLGSHRQAGASGQSPRLPAVPRAAVGFRTVHRAHPLEDDDRSRLAAPAKEESAWLRRQHLAHKSTREAMAGRDATPTLDQARDAADAAWRERNARMSNAWRNRV